MRSKHKYTITVCQNGPSGIYHPVSVYLDSREIPQELEWHGKSLNALLSKVKKCIEDIEENRGLT